MKRSFYLLLIFLLCAAGLCAQEKRAETVPLADPFILYEDGMYYMYGTGSDLGIPVVVSRDM